MKKTILPYKLNINFINLFLTLFLFQILIFPQAKISKEDSENVNVALGIPQDKTPDDDYLIFRPQYVLSYNQIRNVPNWASWELNSKWFGNGKVKRYPGKFITDNTLPADYYHVTHSDYSNSGYDRGHMVQSKQRTRTPEDNKATFFITNVVPQTPDLNQGVWLRFEDYCEKLAKEYNKELYIIAGGIYHSDNKINDLIAIPDSCFKIVVILDEGEGIKDINTKTQTIAVVMPNEQGVRNIPWQTYTTTIRRIENSTGYDFLSNLNKKIQNALETRVFVDAEE